MTGLPLPHLADPWWLLLLTLVPLLAWRHHRRPALGALTYSRLPATPGAAGRLGGAFRLHLPFYARLLALAVTAVALARPQLGYAWEESLTEGIDIEIVLDVSGSMGAEDFQPKNRLTVAKQVVKDFIAGRPADRIGLVSFSGTAMTRAPLTTDRQMLELLVDALEVNSQPDGTAIGVALAAGAARLEASEAQSKVMLLVTDGVNNAGAIDPMSAAALADGLGIKVYTIGVGARDRVPVPMPRTNPLTGEREMRRVIMSLGVDEELLRTIADRTDGRFYKATDREALEAVFAEIDRLEKTELEVKRYVRYREAYMPLAWAALALALLPVAAAWGRVTAEP